MSVVDTHFVQKLERSAFSGNISRLLVALLGWSGVDLVSFSMAGDIKLRWKVRKLPAPDSDL